MSDAGHAHAPYLKIFFWLTVLTVAEIGYTMVGVPRLALMVGLGAMAFVKAALVALFYMHLRYEKRLLWGIILFPVVLATVITLGFLPDAMHYW